jgi:LPXTG-motif cell wall-anchored protein
VNGRFSRTIRIFVALGALVAVMAVAAPAYGSSHESSDTSEVTQADCDAGRIKDKQGNTISGEKCENLIGQRVNLADTGFDAWLIALLGTGLIGGAVVLRRRSETGPGIA